MDGAERELREIAAGDAAAFGRWVARAEPPLRSALRRFAAAVDTEAVVQETLLGIWQVAPRVEPDGRPEVLLRYALGTAHNRAVSELRRQRRLTPADDDELRRALEELEVATQPSAPDPLLRRIIATCRSLLPEQPRRALDARLAGGGGVPDVTLAEQLGMRLNTFLQNITRARRLLAECLRRHGVEPDGEGT